MGVQVKFNRPKPHSMNSRYKRDPRSKAERVKAGGGTATPDHRRDREYFCTCGHVYGNVGESEASRLHRQHKRDVGAT